MLDTIPLSNYDLDIPAWRPEQPHRKQSREPPSPCLNSDIFTANVIDESEPMMLTIPAGSASQQQKEGQTAGNIGTSSQQEKPASPKETDKQTETDEQAAAKSLPPQESSKCSAASTSAVKTKTPSGDLENRASQYELAQQDRLRAEEIFIRMSAERQLHVTKMQAMLTNLATEISRIWEEVAIRRQKIHDDMMAKWEKLLFA